MTIGNFAQIIAVESQNVNPGPLLHQRNAGWKQNDTKALGRHPRLDGLVAKRIAHNVGLFEGYFLINLLWVDVQRSCSQGWANIDLHGYNIQRARNLHILLCQRWCNEDSNCKTWTYLQEKRECYLKEREFGTSDVWLRQGFISGAKNCESGTCTVWPWLNG